MRALSYLSLVNLTSEGQRDGHGDALLEKAADLAGAVDLGAEGGGAEVVLGTDSSGAIAAGATHHHGGGVGSKLEVHVDTGLDALGQLAPVGGSKGALGLQLGGTDPVVSLVLGAVGQSSFGTSVQALALPDGLETESEAGSDGLEVATDEDTGQTALEAGGVEGLQGSREIIASVVIVELEQALSGSRHNLSVGLGDQSLGPAVVVDGREGTIASEVTLHEDLLQSGISVSN